MLNVNSKYKSIKSWPSQMDLKTSTTNFTVTFNEDLDDPYSISFYKFLKNDISTRNKKSTRKIPSKTINSTSNNISNKSTCINDNSTHVKFSETHNQTQNHHQPIIIIKNNTKNQYAKDLKGQSKKLFSNYDKRQQQVLNDLLDNSSTSIVSDCKKAGLEKDKNTKWSKNNATSLASWSTTSLGNMNIMNTMPNEEDIPRTFHKGVKIKTAGRLIQTINEPIHRQKINEQLFENKRSEISRISAQSYSNNIVPDPVKVIKINSNKLFKEGSLESGFQQHNDCLFVRERENTTFSAKFNYDQFLKRTNTMISHSYADLNNDFSLKLTKENFVENMRIKNSDNMSRTTTPNIYQTFEKPANISIYSDLINNFQQQQPPSVNSSNFNTLVTDKISSFTIKNSYTNQNIAIKKKIKSKIKMNIKTIKIIKKKKNDAVTSNSVDKQSKSKQVQKILLEGSNLAFDSFNNNNSNKYSLNNVSTELKNSDLVRIDQSNETNSFLGKLKLKNIKESSPKKTLKKLNSNSQQTLSISKKKSIIREFKYVILTDLKIGEGEFSETFQAYRYDLGPPMRIAAKRLKTYNKEYEENQRTVQLLSEIAALSELGKHEHVIDYLGVFTSVNTMYMIFEYADNGDLKRFLDTLRRGGRREFYLNKLKVCYEIASGMEYISSLGIVHKDLAARNILLDKNYRSKIADFGCCKLEFLEKKPVRWMAPETFSKLLFTQSSDVWSFGILMWEIYTNGMIPYPGMTDDQVLSRVLRWYRLYKPSDCPDEIYSMMLLCWKEISLARPKFSQLKAKFKELHKSLDESTTEEN